MNTANHNENVASSSMTNERYEELMLKAGNYVLAETLGKELATLKDEEERNCFASGVVLRALSLYATQLGEKEMMDILTACNQAMMSLLIERGVLKIQGVEMHRINPATGEHEVCNIDMPDKPAATMH